MAGICSRFRVRGSCKYGCDATRTICHRFKRGLCAYGWNCSGMHEATSIAVPLKLCHRVRDRIYCRYGCTATRTMCHDFVRGNCAFGEGCRKVHEGVQSSGNVREHTASSEVASASTRADPLASNASRIVGSTRNASRERSRSRRRHAPSPLCCVCFAQNVGSVALPCGHVVMCWDCANFILGDTRICPTCRQTMHEIHRAYL